MKKFSPADFRKQDYFFFGLTDLLWKLPGYSLLPQAEQKEDGEYFANG